jgi:hypothetical protein
VGVGSSFSICFLTFSTRDEPYIYIYIYKFGTYLPCNHLFCGMTTLLSVPTISGLEYFAIFFLLQGCSKSKSLNHLSGDSVVRTWDQEVCSLCGLRFELALWLLIWWPLETYMVVNFRTREISRDTHKLTRTPTLN